MGTNGHRSREYLSIDIPQENNLEEVLEPTLDCCIYRVPQYLRQINEEAYTPKSISIGPLHYGRKELMGMENQKKRLWSKFWERVNNAQKLEEFKIYIINQEQCIRDHYSVSSALQSSEYVAMIQLDAVFIIELFVRNYRQMSDFLLNSLLGNFIKGDLLLLENQVPFFVLNHLYMETFLGSEENLSFFAVSVYYFGGIMNSNRLSLGAEQQVKHFTDLLRRAFVMEFQPEESYGGVITDLPNATKLNNYGVKFRGTDKCCLDISLVKRRPRKWLPFAVIELQIPRILIHYRTEAMFQNTMALEQFHYPRETHVCNYAFLMENLINTEKDVDLLVEKGIIVNCIGANEVIAKMFNGLGTYMVLSNSPYYNDVKRLKQLYGDVWNNVQKALTVKVIFVAIFYLILSVIEAVGSVMQLF